MGMTSDETRLPPSLPYQSARSSPTSSRKPETRAVLEVLEKPVQIKTRKSELLPTDVKELNNRIMRASRIYMVIPVEVRDRLEAEKDEPETLPFYFREPPSDGNKA